MFAFAFAVGFQDGVPNGDRVQAMMAGFPAWPPPDGTCAEEVGHAAAAVARWAVVRRDLLVVPRWDPRRQLLFAGDVRLHNRRELAEVLELPAPLAELSDLDLAGLAYMAWGEQAPRRLLGDFAFVVWDERRRTLFATRDPLGVRPLYFTFRTDGAALASDVRQLLPLLPRPYDDVDERSVFSRFVHAAHRPGSTFFRSISLLQPGHSLIVEDGKPRQVRHWNPPVEPRRSSYADNCAELLQLFLRGVRDRLESDHPLIAHSSGGFDSSTIVMASAAVYQAEPERQPLIMASALSAGFECDDSRYMDEIAAHVPFEPVVWSAIETGPTPPSLPSPLIHPGFRRGAGGGPRRDLELATERGARVLLGGMYGDEVLFAGGVHLDMFRGHRWGALLRETLVLRDPRGRGGRMLLESFLGVLPPPLALRMRKRLFQGAPATPEWFGPRLQSLSTIRAPRKVESQVSWPSHVAYTLWAQLTGTRVTDVLDSIILYASEAGIEMRLPYADVRLVQHLLTTPWDQRFPNGHLRRFGRDALGPLLPPLLSTRTRQADWKPVFVANARRYQAFIATVLNDRTWHSAPYVDRHKARAMLQEARKKNGTTPANTWTLLLELVGLECWLRTLFCYNPPAR